MGGRSKPSAELFRQQTVNEIVTAACRDLQLGLGIIHNPTLCEKWEHMQVKSQAVTSPLLLPDGTHYLRLQEQSK